MARYERELDRVAREVAAVQTALAAPQIYSDGAKGQLRELMAKQARLTEQSAELEAAWLLATEQLERKSGSAGV